MEHLPQKVVRHYLQEMEALRHEGVIFAKSYPEVARELGMGEDHWTDPQAEMLVQSFAYLAARIRNQLDIDKSAIPNALLNHLYPYMQAPSPCMAVAEAEVSATTADGRPLERGRVFSVEAQSGNKKLSCRFTNCYDTPIWPLTIGSIGSVAVKDMSFLAPSETAEIYSVVKVGVKRQAAAKTPIKELSLKDKGLGFYISDRNRSAMRLYELLSTSLSKIYLRQPESEKVTQLELENFVWRGFEDEDAVLPDKAEMHPGYRLIREYFGFPQKFLFFDIKGMELSDSNNEFEIYFAFDEHLRSDIEFTQDCLKLNCFPIINLAEQPVEPIRLTQRRYEYPVDSDRINQSYSEIYSIESLYSLEPGEAPRKISPCFELAEFDAAEDMGYFYSFRRELIENAKVPGTRTYLSFHNHNLKLSDVPGETIGGTALCTNRRLPEKLNSENANLLLEGAGPVTGAKLVSKMSAYTEPRLDEHSSWQLVSQLSLNFLSISGTDKALDSFKHILKAYADIDNPVVAKQILGVKSVRAERETRYITSENNSGMVQGIKIIINLDDHAFSEGRALLFASVCRYFFVLYANLGSYVQLVLETDKRGDWKTWQPMAGALVEL